MKSKLKSKLKTKARDIIPGWPKGKSTSSFDTWQSWRYQRPWFMARSRYTYIGILQRAAYCFETVSVSDYLNQRNFELEMCDLELAMNTQYHKEQQEMLYAYLERYRSSRKDQLSLLLSLLHDEMIALLFSNGYETFTMDDKYITYVSNKPVKPV